MVASRALVVVQTAMYLTGISDCLTGFHEPLSPPYKCHTSLKNVLHDHCFISLNDPPAILLTAKQTDDPTLFSIS